MMNMQSLGQHLVHSQSPVVNPLSHPHPHSHPSHPGSQQNPQPPSHLLPSLQQQHGQQQQHQSSSSSTPGDSGGLNSRPISPAMIQCGITDEELVSLSVRDLNRQLKMRGLNREEIVTMKQR
ncbi:MAFF_G_K [Lepeophtheirus salmonis]|uniref:MAFF_G_K n=3 Tax=Lepeophtheirus salmonis TaxID=72036 RepID=A0A7R8CZ89_LEPSM|nr:MAFF_G_K [Lepeophtheirus salmonis]CAF2931241.1 MAFF_G_K [Lepeophtheirus salmonis]